MDESEESASTASGNTDVPAADPKAGEHLERAPSRLAWFALPALSLGLIGHCAAKAIARSGDDAIRLASKTIASTNDGMMRSHVLRGVRAIRTGAADVARGTRGFAQHGLVHMEGGATAAARQAVSPSHIVWSEPLGSAAATSAGETACNTARALVRDALVSAGRARAVSAEQFESILVEASKRAGCTTDAVRSTLRISTSVEGRTIHAAFPIRELATAAVRIYAASEATIYVIDRATITIR